MHSIGAYVDVVKRWVTGFCLSADIFWQHGHCLMYALISCLMPSNTFPIFFRFRKVRLNPPCPTVELWTRINYAYISAAIGLQVRIAVMMCFGILFLHRRDIASVTSLFFLGIYPIVKSNSCSAQRHLPTILFLSLYRKVRFLLSVRIVNLRSRSRASR